MSWGVVTWHGTTSSYLFFISSLVHLYSLSYSYMFEDPHSPDLCVICQFLLFSPKLYKEPFVAGVLPWYVKVEFSNWRVSLSLSMHLRTLQIGIHCLKDFGFHALMGLRDPFVSFMEYTHVLCSMRNFSYVVPLC